MCLIYAGTDDGNVWVTQNSGANWTLLSDTLPNLWVTKVLASSSEVSHVYVTFSGYRYGEDNGHVFKSADFGSTWIDISNNLPDIPVNDILKDNYGNLFLGTDIGVLASADEGENWEPLGINMPSVVVNDMHIHENSEYLYVVISMIKCGIYSLYVDFARFCLHLSSDDIHHPSRTPKEVIT